MPSAISKASRSRQRLGSFSLLLGDLVWYKISEFPKGPSTVSTVLCAEALMQDEK